KFLPALKQSLHAEIVAIASRSFEKASAVAASLGVKKFYGSYDELLADPNVEAIYNPLPNDLHVPFSIKALESGKHVLCEKPIAVTAGEAQQLLLASNALPNLKEMEALLYRIHPQWQ